MSYMGQSDVKGVVLIDVWIDESGRVTCVRVTRSIPILDAAIVTAVQQWKFAPAMMGDKPVAVVQQVGVRFPPVK
jgi:TonB family protein